MNYTTGIPTNYCICEKPGTLNQACVPPMTEQVNYLLGRADRLRWSANRLAYFLTGNGVDEDAPDDKTISANLAYVIRTMDAVSSRLETISEFYH